ncbi:MAG: tRNA (adenosine(37)-N6)-threonylcarbamoyltransferase complex transferase subunit TsaD [Desulfobulbaceae bacterium]|uniref:tRNA N6-adenosine threonylcarbamoyltransferase n=1 Tax=Candidatus Desulfatifera sulfidica TaxID=2841691 RepID=A0A8J6N857_9BACT|nr:tRNA (adenosine(37)-N6)-threonylcarbamoyltransferase complex transferase subunit TsaD [Candidatus Desulfatifera sulfidica]
MLTLGIESSCDDTAAAILKDNGTLLSSVLSSQDETHSPFGGVVPELASRQHLKAIVPMVQTALYRAEVTLADIDLISVTQGPGLIGSLLVGFSYAKALASVRNIPLVGVDHMAGHILAALLEEEKPSFPYIALVVSGGSSSIYLAQNTQTFTLLGRTRDDAAGEAFDKVAKLLNLGYPGGPRVSKEASTGRRSAIRFPRAWLEENSLDFSFSGLKTAVLNHCHKEKQNNSSLAVSDICASFQEAVVEVLMTKTLMAADIHGINTIVLGGGVSSNPRLREAMTEACAISGKKLFTPSPEYCTDNGAMIALAGYFQFQTAGPMPPEQDVYSRSRLT